MEGRSRLRPRLKDSPYRFRGSLSNIRLACAVGLVDELLAIGRDGRLQVWARPRQCCARRAAGLVGIDGQAQISMFSFRLAKARRSEAAIEGCSSRPAPKVNRPGSEIRQVFGKSTPSTGQRCLPRRKRECGRSTTHLEMGFQPTCSPCCRKIRRPGFTRPPDSTLRPPIEPPGHIPREPKTEGAPSGDQQGSGPRIQAGEAPRLEVPAAAGTDGPRKPRLRRPSRRSIFRPASTWGPGHRPTWAPRRPGWK
jgi:hypothetical protein